MRTARLGADISIVVEAQSTPERGRKNVDESIKVRATGLISRYLEETPGTDSLGESLDGIIGWLNKKAPDLSVTTAKCYRKWLAGYLEYTKHPEADRIRFWIPSGSRDEQLHLDAEEASIVAEHVRIGGVRTNDTYYAYMPEESMRVVLTELSGTRKSGTARYSSGIETALFLISTMMTGLRPVEWQEAEIHDQYYDPHTMVTLGPVLHVVTAKQDKRREDNPLRGYRLLVLNEWSADQIDQLRGFLAQIPKEDEAFRRFYDRCRKTLTRVWKKIKDDPAIIVHEETSSAAKKKLGGEGVSLAIYSCRHIFAEEIRRSRKYTRFELAALLGHSMLTNQKYYGPRTREARTYDFSLPKAWPGDAEEISLWDRRHNPMAHISKQGLLPFGMEEADAAEDMKDGISGFYMR